MCPAGKAQEDRPRARLLQLLAKIEPGIVPAEVQHPSHGVIKGIGTIPTLLFLSVTSPPLGLLWNGRQHDWFLGPS